MRDRKVDLTRRDVLENFRAYGLPSPDLIRMDNHLFHRHFRSLRPQIDPKDRTGEAPAYCTGWDDQSRAGRGIYYIFIFIFIFIHDIDISASKLHIRNAALLFCIPRSCADSSTIILNLIHLYLCFVCMYVY